MVTRSPKHVMERLFFLERLKKKQVAALKGKLWQLHCYTQIHFYFLSLTYQYIYQMKQFTKKCVIFILAVLMKTSIPIWFQLNSKLISISKLHQKKG